MPNNGQMGPVYLQSGLPETENSTSLQYKGQLGMRFTDINPPRAAVGAVQGRSKSYQLIRSDSTMSVDPFPGAVAWWSDKTQYLVTTSPTALGRGRIAGIFLNALTKGNYGCVQIGGPVAVKFVDAPTANPTAAGLFVIPSATAGKADCLAAGTPSSYPSLGVSAGVYDATNTLGVVDLDVPTTT